jgi:excinuclease ABC subunit C
MSRSALTPPAATLPPEPEAPDLDDFDALAETERSQAEEEPNLSPIDTDGEAPLASVRRGAAAIRTFWQHAPPGPGVYRMIAEDGEVLYVGKAKSVRKRIASYMRAQGHTNRIARMIALTASMVFVSTGTETEALLLETNLIKQLKPRFNVLMRDDKSFPYILLTGDHAAPQILKHRGSHQRKGDYFGPFASVGAVNRTLNALQRAFLLRSCSDSYYENRTRPCLLHQIKRCSAPCTGEISHTDYAELVREAHDFLSGKSRAVRELLARDMQGAAEQLDFERAARLRDRVAALSAIQGSQGVNPRTVEEADVFAIHEDAGQFCVEVFFFRTYQNWGNRAYFPRADRSLTLGEVLGAFLAQFYAERPAPRLVLLSSAIEETDLLAEALCLRSGHRVEIAVPQRGEKRELVEAALQNARETLGRKLADTASQVKLLGLLGAAVGTPVPLRRVEVYDNSHIMGTNAIGAMVVAGPAGFMKTHYRTFNIRSEELTPGDDYGMMREVLRRRFSRLMKEAPRQTPIAASEQPATGVPKDDLNGVCAPLAARVPPSGIGPSMETLASQAPRDEARGAEKPSNDPDAFPAWPDLVLIDGGRGQFDAAREVLAECGVTGVTLVSIAKGRDRDAGRETFFVAGREPFRLAPRDPALYFAERLRDEAHRFAIGTHRARRKREFTRSPLDEIGGIGPARKRALLESFGTAKAISRAALTDLEKVPGINAAMARLVYDYFHERR